jgi:hypothetical protein
VGDEVSERAALSILVVCDNPRHGGKVAKIVSFLRDENGAWWHYPGNQQSKRQWGRSHGMRVIAAGLDARQPAQDYGCKLCGQKLPHWRDVRPLFPILNECASRGVSRIGMTELIGLLSRQR